MVLLLLVVVLLVMVLLMLLLLVLMLVDAGSVCAGTVAGGVAGATAAGADGAGADGSMRARSLLSGPPSEMLCLFSWSPERQPRIEFVEFCAAKGANYNPVQFLKAPWNGERESKNTAGPPERRIVF